MADNPYAPVSIERESAISLLQTNPGPRLDAVSLTTWPIVVGLNIIVPVLLGSEVSGAEGQVGMWVAVLICLIAGWGLCLWRPMTARKLVLGSLLLSMTQMVPILQILCGAIALGIVGGSIEGSDGDLGFLRVLAASLLVASFLLPIAAGLGWLLSIFLPQRWFKDRV